MAEPVLQQRLLTVEEYHAMAQAGILTEDDRVELLTGKIVEMSPIGPRHFHCVNRLNQLLVQRAVPHAVVSVQNPMRLSFHSEPEPDVVLLRPDLDFTRIAQPEDVLLLIEVAETTVERDRQIKLPLYAEAGVAEVWLVVLPEETLEVYRQPEGRALQAGTVPERLGRWRARRGAARAGTLCRGRTAWLR